MGLNANQMTTGEGRISYVHVYEPYSNNGGEPKYSVTFLMPKIDVQSKARLTAAEEAAKQKGITEKWNGVLPPVIASAIYDGDGVRPNGEPFGAECKGCWVFTASSKNPVPLVDANMNPIVQKGEIYSGCYGRICVSLFAYNSNGKRGIGIGLEAVQKLRDGDPLGGGVSVSDAFGGMPAPAAAPAAAPAQPIYQQPAPAQPMYQQPAPAQPMYQQPYQPSAAAMQPSAAFDPITGAPL